VIHHRLAGSAEAMNMNLDFCDVNNHYLRKDFLKTQPLQGLKGIKMKKSQLSVAVIPWIYRLYFIVP